MAFALSVTNEIGRKDLIAALNYLAARVVELQANDTSIALQLAALAAANTAGTYVAPTVTVTAPGTLPVPPA